MRFRRRFRSGSRFGKKRSLRRGKTRHQYYVARGGVRL